MRINCEKQTLCIQVTYAEITHFMQKKNPIGIARAGSNPARSASCCKNDKQ